MLPGSPKGVAFVKAEGHDAIEAISNSQSSLLIVSEQVFELALATKAKSVIAVVDPRLEFARILNKFFAPEPALGVDPAATVHSAATLGRDCYVGPNAYIEGDVVLGERCRVGAGTALLKGTRVGDDTTFGPNCTIGYVGFGYARDYDGTPVALPHSGGVLIGSHVDIGANTCIDRGTLRDTQIADGVKVDNLVHIAHNCYIGEGAFVIANATLCGGVQVGPRAWIAPTATIREQLVVGEDSVVGLAATVVRNVAPRTTVVGSPAIERER